MMISCHSQSFEIGVPSSTPDLREDYMPEAFWMQRPCLDRANVNDLQESGLLWFGDWFVCLG